MKMKSMKMNNSLCFEKLLQGLENVLEGEGFRKKAKNTMINASNRIIQDTKDGKIIWKRDLGQCLAWYDYFTATVTVENAEGKEIKLPAIIHHSLGEYEDVCLCLGNIDLDRLNPLASYTHNTAFREIVENTLHITCKQR